MIVHLANVAHADSTEDAAMPSGVIVSYDGTANDDDALALARMLGSGPLSISLAYVRHSREYDPAREEIAAHDAQRRLDLGAVFLEDPDVARHVVIDPSTGVGLGRLAAEQDAEVVVFGSEYRTTPGRVEPGRAALHLLSSGTVAVAVARAGLRIAGRATIETISVAPGEDDDAPAQTAAALAQALGATVLSGEDPRADLIVVGSAASAAPGTIGLSGATRAKLDSARSSVLVLARETPILL